MSSHDNSETTGTGVLQPTKRLAFSGLFHLAPTVFVVAVLFYAFLHSLNGAQPNSLLFNLFCFSLAGLSVALASAGIVDMAIHRGYTHDWLAAGKICVSVVAGFALTFLSAPYPPYGFFESSYTGFPLPFSATSYASTFGSFTSGNPVAFLIDCAFWIALAFPAVWFAGSVMQRNLRVVGRLEGVGFASFLTYGTYPGWAALLSLGFFNSTFVAIGSHWPLLTLCFFFLPSAVVGTLSAVRGNKTLGLTIVLASLLLVSLFGLVILTDSLHVVL